MNEQNQHKLQFEKIIDDELHQKYLITIADVYCRRILDSILDESKSAIEISIDTQIPLRTVYRRIQNMVDNKIVKISGNITENVKKIFYVQKQNSRTTYSLL